MTSPDPRSVFGRSRDRVLWPITTRLDSFMSDVSVRLEELSRRVAAVERVMRSFDGRAATAAERAVTVEAANADLDRRLRAIEDLLAGRPEPPLP